MQECVRSRMPLSLGSRNMSLRQNHYQFLNVEETAGREEIERAVRRLTNEANTVARSSPRRAQEIRKRLPGIKRDLLTNDSRRNAYDRRALAQESESDEVDLAEENEEDGLVPAPRSGSARAREQGSRARPMSPGMQSFR